MTLSQRDLERQWPEGPVVAYRVAAQRLDSSDEAVACPATLSDAPVCWELRGAVRGLMELEAQRIETTRQAKRLNPRSWLLTSSDLNNICRVVLDGVRQS